MNKHIKEDHEGFVKGFSNSDCNVSYAAMEDKPFYFADVNFDGIKELILSENHLYEVDGIKVNTVYEITSDSFKIINYSPLNYITNFYDDGREVGFRNGFLDFKNDEIIVGNFFGCCIWTNRIYRVNEDKTDTKNIFVLNRTEENDAITRKGYNVQTIKITGKQDIIKTVKLKESE